jgi:hypothetical protein
MGLFTGAVRQFAAVVTSAMICTGCAVGQQSPDAGAKFDPGAVQRLLEKKGFGAKQREQFPGSKVPANGPLEAEIVAFRARIDQCWKPPRGMRDDVSIEVSVGLNPDGSLAKLPHIDSAGLDGSELAKTVISAIQDCQPYNMFSPERYATWSTLLLVFRAPPFPSH